MFYDNLDILCAERGITISRLLEILDLSRSSASRWKTKGYLPSRDTAKKIAEYFGMTVQELLDIEKAPAVNQDNERLERFHAAIRGLSPDQEDEALRYIEYLQSKQNQ